MPDKKKETLEDYIVSTFEKKIKKLLNRKIDAHLISTHKHKSKTLKEEAPTNTVGGGQVAMFDPILHPKKVLTRVKEILKKKKEIK